MNNMHYYNPWSFLEDLHIDCWIKHLHTDDCRLRFWSKQLALDTFDAPVAPVQVFMYLSRICMVHFRLYAACCWRQTAAVRTVLRTVSLVAVDLPHRGQRSEIQAAKIQKRIRARGAERAAHPNSPQHKGVLAGRWIRLIPIWLDHLAQSTLMQVSNRVRSINSFNFLRISPRI